MGWTSELPDAVRKLWRLEEDMIILFAGFGYREHRDSERAVCKIVLCISHAKEIYTTAQYWSWTLGC
jgi:hypothetical protein